MKEHIISEIKRIAIENDGAPPGMDSFASKSGIASTDWRGIYWARWSDALLEAGFEPNAFQTAIDETILLMKLAECTRHYGHFPTEPELQLYQKSVEYFPSIKTYRKRFGSKNGMIEALREWSVDQNDFEDVLAVLPEIRNTPARVGKPEQFVQGFVYLLKSGRHYKIGRSENVERRLKEVTTALPEKVTLEHAIKTDDTSGIEAYWHRRFSDKRANGEWFELSDADVRAFKRRSFQ